MEAINLFYCYCVVDIFQYVSVILVLLLFLYMMFTIQPNVAMVHHCFLLKPHMKKHHIYSR